MKVLHVISDENIGGAGVLLVSLLKNMDRGRVDSVVAMPKNSLLAKRISELKIPVRYLTHSCDRLDGRSVREIKQMIEEEQIDIVHANAAICARIAGKLAHKTVIHTRHCCFPPEGIWKNDFIRWIGGRINQLLSDRVIATADAAAENLSLLGIPRSMIEVIINGSEQIREVSQTELNEWREKLHIKNKDFCVGICARLEEYKGHDTFLRAAKLLLKKRTDISFRFLIVGTGSMYEALQNEVKKEGLENFVRFTGFVEDMAPIYRLLDLNVNCSRGTETSCLALSEGMSAGVPFVASDYGGNAAMLGESEAGILVSVDDADAFAKAIYKIAVDPILYDRMSLSAFERYKEKYTAAEMGEHLTAVYEDFMRFKCAKQAKQQ